MTEQPKRPKIITVSTSIFLILLLATQLRSTSSECFGRQASQSQSEKKFDSPTSTQIPPYVASGEVTTATNHDEISLLKHVGLDSNSNFGPGDSFQQTLYDHHLEFALDMFDKLNKKDDKTNIFFSPFSIQQALMMAFFGSSSTTEKQLRSALHLGSATKTELIHQFKMENYFMEARAQNTTQYNLKVANRVYFSKEEPIRSCVSEILDNEIELLDFANDTENSRIKINSWIESQTNGKIKEIIPSGFIQPDTRMAIANSAYFKGNWEHQFKKSHTKISLFYVSPNEVTQTTMMYQKGSFRHGISQDLMSYILELPYNGEALSMFILLPPFTPNAIDETISRLNSSTLRAAMDDMEHISIDVSIPKFKIEQTFELNKALQSLGVVDLFDDANADLSEFSDKPGLAVGTARHKSFIEINEEGSEAAAATLLIDTRSGRPVDQSRFICNHPFLFFIHDNAANTILFMGVYRNPKTIGKI